ncbi:MAG: hypothetical protein RIR37_238 [Verrucomicrobiota bacterium]
MPKVIEHFEIMQTILSLRPLIPLAIGLVLGGAGATLYRNSMPAAAGSPEERAQKLESDLKRANIRIAALEGSMPESRRRPTLTVTDRLRDLGQNIRDGRPVSPDDIFRACQPLLRDLAPLFDRMRVRNGQRTIDSRVGEMARKYNLNAAQQESLKQWFRQKAEDDAKAWTALVTQEGTRIEDMMRASRDARPDEGLDRFMENILSGQDLAKFRTERINEKAQRVQQYADMKVERLNKIVSLDAEQTDKVFGIMARSSKDYDPALSIEGTDGRALSSVGDSREAMLSVLRPDQRAAYDAEQQRRRDEASKDLEAIGLKLPADWDPLDDF